MSGRLEGRVALVTGASRGIGAAVARRFASEGARLILVARNAGALEEIDDAVRAAGAGESVLVPLDLTDFPGIDRLGAALFERFGRLDVLVGNAATLGVLGPLSHADPKVWQRVFDINVTANWRLIRIFEPLLRRSEAGRAIFVTSGVTWGAFPFWGPYAASKAALESMVGSWAAELEKTAIRVNLVDPGVVATRMRAEAFPGEDSGTLSTPDEVAGIFVDLAEAACRSNGERLQA